MASVDSTQPGVLDLEGLERHLSSGGAGFRLKVPTLNARAGDFVAVVGASGCGKSTLLDVLGLVSQPTTAERFELVSKDGHKHNVASYWQSDCSRELSSLRCSTMGYVLQTGGLFPYLTVRENLLLPARLKGLDVAAESIYDMAEKFNLIVSGDRYAFEGFLKKKPRHLSGGQRQRTAIMRALLSKPAIILADEPTAAIDRITARRIVELFSDIAKSQGIVVVMVTHDRRLLRDVATKAYSFDLQVSGDDTNIHSISHEISLSEL